MAKKKVHSAPRRVQVGRGDGWRVWTESLDCCCCCCGYAQGAGVSMAIEDCDSLELGLWVRLVSSARQKQRNEKGRTRGHGEETNRTADVYQMVSSVVVR